MRLAWDEALKQNIFNAFLLLNDDVILENECFIKLIYTHNYSLQISGKSGIYVGSTYHGVNDKISYGGYIITINNIVMKSKKVIPKEYPVKCHLANANILWVSAEVVKEIGIFDSNYIHGIADFDYTFFAYRHNIPIWVAPEICGTCSSDSQKTWKSISHSLKERIIYLKDPKGLAYYQYLYYIRKHFPLFLPYSFIMLWLKTLFPIVWDKYKLNSPSKFLNTKCKNKE